MKHTHLLAHGRGTTLAGIGLVGLGLGDTLGEDLSVLVLQMCVSGFRHQLQVKKGHVGKTYGLVLDLLSLAALEGSTVALVLETLGGDESLDLGGLGVGGLALALGLDLAANDVLADLFHGEVSRHVGDTNLAKKTRCNACSPLVGPLDGTSFLSFFVISFPVSLFFLVSPEREKKGGMFKSNQK